jgi:hypothetical protein
VVRYEHICPGKIIYLGIKKLVRIEVWATAHHRGSIPTQARGRLGISARMRGDHSRLAYPDYTRFLIRTAGWVER